MVGCCTFSVSHSGPPTVPAPVTMKHIWLHYFQFLQSTTAILLYLGILQHFTPHCLAQLSFVPRLTSLRFYHPPLEPIYAPVQEQRRQMFHVITFHKMPRTNRRPQKGLPPKQLGAPLH